MKHDTAARQRWRRKALVALSFGVLLTTHFGAYRYGQIKGQAKRNRDLERQAWNSMCFWTYQTLALVRTDDVDERAQIEAWAESVMYRSALELSQAILAHPRPTELRSVARLLELVQEYRRQFPEPKCDISQQELHRLDAKLVAAVLLL